MVCFTAYLQKAVRILFILPIDKLGVQCHRLRHHRWLVVSYGAAFSDVTIVLMCDVTIMLMLVPGDINNALLGHEYGAFQTKPSDLGPSDLWSNLRKQRQKTPQLTWDQRQCKMTCHVTWLGIGERKRAQDSDQRWRQGSTFPIGNAGYHFSGTWYYICAICIWRATGFGEGISYWKIYLALLAIKNTWRISRPEQLLVTEQTMLGLLTNASHV